MSTSSPATTVAPRAATPAPTQTGLIAHLIACAIGAGIDNLYRMVALITLSAAAIREFPHDPSTAAAQAQKNSQLALILFSAPFVLLAPLAGSLGDRLPKQVIVRGARIADVLICALGIWGYAIDNVAIILTAFTLLAIASTFFAPVKLAILPELVDDVRLARANAQLAAVTVIAILLGTCTAVCMDPVWLTKITSVLSSWAHLPTHPPGHSAAVWSLSIVSASACLIGVIAAFRVPSLPAQAPRTPIGMPWMILSQIKALRSDHGLMLPAFALAGFWSLGGIAVIGLQPIATFTYRLQPAGTVGLFLAIVVGICIGSALAPRYRARAFPAGLPIFGAILAGAAFLAAGWQAQHDAGLPLDHRHLTTMIACLFLTGVGGGMWEVAVTVMVQERASAQRRNLIMSGVSVLASLGTLLTAAFAMALGDASNLSHGLIGNRDEAQTFQIIGALTVLSALACGIVYRRQCAAWSITVLLKLAYRVTVHGAGNLPISGGCLVVCNHLSYADGVILASNLPRPGRFLVYRTFVDMPVFGFFLRSAGVIPVAAEDGRKALLASIDAAVAAAKAGEVVVIFPEGKISRSGQMDVFRAGLERIATRADVLIVPAFLHGLWGSALSLAYRRSLPRPWRRVDLYIGAPLPSDTSAAAARDQVMSLSYQSAQDRSDRDHRTLASAFLTQARRHPRHIAIRDAGGHVGNAAALGISRALHRHLGLADHDARVGVILPPGRAGTLVNLALAMDGRTVVNINHTCGPAQIQRMCRMAGIQTVISAGPYLRKIGLTTLPGRLVQIEDVLPRLGTIEIFRHMLAGLLLPDCWRKRAPQSDDVAVIIFSSGSTGDPKGVELTHRQVLANCDCTEDGLDVHGGTDILLSPLPLFHSFGLVPGMWLGLTKGMTVVSHPDPSDGKALGALAQATGATFLISTPSFVRGYLRRIEPSQLKTLRFAVVGAERCPVDLMATFKERYDADLLEGYGCTELAPVVGVNLQDHVRGAVTEVRRKPGTIGRALPGLHVFSVDPVSNRILVPGEEGLLVVRSPSRMRGYLDRDDLTQKAFIHGGYNTGDIGRVDGEGFVSITGRLARFAKVAGEMVPLDNVEAAVQKLLTGILGSESPIEMAVSAVSDDSRGERLVIMHTGFHGDWPAILDGLTELPTLWRPKPKDVRLVGTIPKLGTGKRDLSAIKALASQMMQAAEPQSH